MKHYIGKSNVGEGYIYYIVATSDENVVHKIGGEREWNYIIIIDGGCRPLEFKVHQQCRSVHEAVTISRWKLTLLQFSLHQGNHCLCFSMFCSSLEAQLEFEKSTEKADTDFDLQRER